MKIECVIIWMLYKLHWCWNILLIYSNSFHSFYVKIQTVSLSSKLILSEDRQFIQLHPGPRNRVSWSTYFAYRCCSGQMLVDRPTKNGLIWIHHRIKSLTYSWLWNIIPGNCHFMRISCRNITQRPVQRIHIHFPCLRHLWSNDHVTYEKSRELSKGKLL